MEREKENIFFPLKNSFFKHQVTMFTIRPLLDFKLDDRN